VTIGEINGVDIVTDIPAYLLISSNRDPIASIVHSTYPNILDCTSDISYFQDRAILAPKNSIVEHINECMLDLIAGE